MNLTRANRYRLISLIAFVGVILATNVLTIALGPVVWLGLAATAGTWIAGLSFIARDSLQERGGHMWVAGAILLGTALSALLSPALAIASAVAFILSEVSDWAVYTPLRKGGKIKAALASNIVGSFVDTFAFLMIAGFPLAMLPTQVLVKVGISTLVVWGVSRAVSRKPLLGART